MTASKKTKKFVIDTSSLLVLVRHLLKFDRDGKLLKIIKEMFSQGTAVLHEVVHEEIHRKMVAGALGFLHSAPRVLVQKPTPARLRHVHDHWINKERNLTDIKLEEYSLKADCQIIEHCRRMNAKMSSIEHVVVTEELPYLDENSNARPRPFKKIPDICASEGVRCMNLVDMLKEIDVRARFWQGRKSDKGDRSQR